MLISALLTLVPGSLISGDWTALPLPSFCDPVPSESFLRLDEGSHIALDETRMEGASSPSSELAPSDLGLLLESSARSSGVDLERFPYAPPLLVRGSNEALAWARDEVSSLARASQRNQIQLTVLLARGALEESEARQLMSTQEPGAASGTHRLWRRTVSPGVEVAFGERTRQRFLAEYDVNVATDSGVAAPRIGSAFTGETLHLSGSRVERGGRVFLRGWLDLSEAGEVEVFDPGSPDLGALEQPTVQSLCLAFSGVVRGAELLRVEVEGAPLSTGEWTLFVGATTDKEPTELSGQQWSALDLSLVTEEPPRFTAFSPGAGLDDQAQLTNLGGLFETMSPMGVLAAAEPRRRSPQSGAGATRAASHVGERTLLLSAGWWAQHADYDLDSLMAALESPRLAMEQLELTDGTLRVSFPVTSGEPARLIAGHERTLLTGYLADIAPNTWMPRPIVERAFDGIAWQGRLESVGVRSSAWRSRTLRLEARSRDEANMGALQLADREVEEGSSLLAGEAECLLLAGRAGSPALSLRRQ